MKNLVIVFARNPELGKVKTRLAQTIGKKSALKVYKLLLEHTEKTIRNMDCDKAIYYSEKIIDNDIWDNTIYQKHQQEGIELGERMRNAFSKTFHDNYEKVILIGSDLFDLQPKHIEEAFNKLNTNDVIIGPAEDGGYYLLGMKILHEPVFKNKKWGNAAVFLNTMQDLQNVDVHLLEELNDIDTFEDLEKCSKLKELISHNE